MLVKLSPHPNQFETSNDLQNVQYSPDIWPSKLANRNMRQCTFTNVSISKTKFIKYTFTECKFTDCLFIGCEFEDVEFHRCEFINCNFHKSKWLRTYIDPKTLTFDKKLKKNYANIGLYTFQSIMENSAKMKQADFEMHADIKRRQWNRYQWDYEFSKKRITRWSFYCKKLKSYSYEFLAGFGYSPMRFAAVTLVLFFVVSVLNHFFLTNSLMINGKIDMAYTFPDSIFYTFSILTALGFSYIIPVTSVAKIVAVLQAFFGIGWLGIFISILVRRFIK